MSIWSMFLDLDLQLVMTKRANNGETLTRGYKMASNGKPSRKGKRKGKQKTEPVPVQELEEPKDMEEEIASESCIC